MIRIQVGGWPQALEFDTPEHAAEFVEAALVNGAQNIGLEVI